MKRILLTALLFLSGIAQAAEPIKIGDVSVYTGDPRRVYSYRKGWEMACDEINAAGGVNGRNLEILSRDDGGDPAKAVRIAEDLVKREHVKILMSLSLANIELALSEFAYKNGIVFVSSNFNSDRLIWQDGNANSFSIGAPALYAFNGMLAERAASKGHKKWAAINPNYEWGQANQAAFEAGLKKFMPDAVWVDKQWPALRGYSMPAIVNAMLNSKADAIYTSLWGPHLAAFVREGQKRGLFDKKVVVSYEIAMQQSLELFKKEIPQGWIGINYPFSELKDKKITAWRKKYIERFGEEPRDSSFLGYVGLYTLADAMKKAGGNDPKKLAATLPGMETDTLIGKQTIRAIDHKTTLGLWVGETALVNGEPKFVNFEYKSGADYMPSDTEIRKMKGQK